MSRSPPKWPSLLLSNKIFRTAGFITHEFKQTIKHPTNQYRLLVTHDGGRVFVAAENNDNDQEILSIVVKSFLLKTCYDIPLRVTSNNGLDPLVEAMTWLMLAFRSILCCPALKPWCQRWRISQQTLHTSLKRQFHGFGMIWSLRWANFAALDFNAVIGNVVDIHGEVAEDAGMLHDAEIELVDNEPGVRVLMRY